MQERPRSIASPSRKIDTNFEAGLFDFPLIDNTRLSNSERVTVSVTDLNSDVLAIAITYFPLARQPEGQARTTTKSSRSSFVPARRRLDRSRTLGPDPRP